MTNRPTRSRDMLTGVHKLTSALKTKQDESFGRSWRDLRNKMDSLLLSTNVMKTDEAKRACLQLDGMTMQERQDYIRERWGPAYVEKVMPILQQLETLEKHIANNAES